MRNFINTISFLIIFTSQCQSQSNDKLILSVDDSKIFISINGTFSEISKSNLEKLINIQELKLEHGILEIVHENSFDNLTQLTTLSLFSNKIHYLYALTFAQLTKLKILNLARNKMEILHPKLFDSLTNLEQVNLNDNKLITLSHRLFTNKIHLRIIEAINNDFQHLDEHTFNELSLQRLALSGSSECHLYNYEIITLPDIVIDIRDNCKGSDFKIYAIHAKILNLIKVHDDD